MVQARVELVRAGGRLGGAEEVIGVGELVRGGDVGRGVVGLGFDGDGVQAVGRDDVAGEGLADEVAGAVVGGGERVEDGDVLAGDAERLLAAQIGGERADLLGRVLQVGVQRHHLGAAGFLKTRQDGHVLAVIARQQYHATWLRYGENFSPLS